MKRLFFVGGNWKCHGVRELVSSLVKDLNDGKITSPDKVEVVVAPPYIALEEVAKTIRPEFKVSAQNCFSEAKGPFTGEISAEMLIDRGIKWVILGHSERRDIFFETDEFVAKKAAHALGIGMSAILCVGEHLEEREIGKTLDIIHRQMKAFGDHLKDHKLWKNVVIAYEPVWAIGTGRTATPQIAQEVHGVIRKWLHDHISATVSDNTRILYGGSVKAANANDLAKMPDVDGFLVGGSSLLAHEFISIINSVNSKE